MDYITQPKDYWIAPNAINISLNALGNPNRIQGSVASGAVISCYIESVDGLGLDNGRNPKRWPLNLSPTYFNSNTQKYVYVAIPRSISVGTQAVVVFPSEKLDIYGKNADNEQAGSNDYYYVWLQGILSSSGTYGIDNREWTAGIDFGKLGTYEDIIDMSESDWYSYSKVTGIVTFLKNITMKLGTTFNNLYLGYKELTGVATAETGEEYVDSETLVVTPSYINGKYLRKDVEDTAQEQIGFLKGLWFGIKGLYEITAEGIAKFKSLFVDDITAQRMQVDDMQSSNYTGDGIADTGWRLTKDYNGHSKLTVDELYVRMKAVFESLEIKKEMVTGGNQIFSRAANVICRTDYYNSDDEVIGYSEVKVPWLLRGLQMVLSKRILAGIYSKVRSVRISIDDPTEIAYIRCYFLAEEGGRKVNNLWSVTGGHDLARCQTFNLSQSERETYVEGTEVKQGNVFWWRKVIGVSSNSSPVEIDGKKYHYFDVSNQQGGYLSGSDLPCAGDEVSQWGNDANEARMHLVTIEVDGGVAIKGYEGIYTFDMSKCWYGGNPCKMNLSPQNEYRFTGRSFKIETEYGVRPVPVDIDVDWASQTKSRAEYAETGISVGDLIVKNYYYDRVPHNGSLWLCLFTGNAYWARYAKYESGTISYVTEDVFNTLTDSQKLYVKVNSRTGLDDDQVCRRQEYTAAEPGTNSAVWKQEVAKGENGIDAQDVEWAYIRTKTNVAPVIDDDENYIDSQNRDYTEDEHLPCVVGNANVENNQGRYECTDDPKGVDDTWKYEWEIKRSKGAATNGHRAWNYYQGTMTLHANFAESAFIIDTDNDNDQFGTDSESKVLVQQVRQTVVSLYDGATQQTLTALSATLTYEDGTSVPSGVAEVATTLATGVVAVTVKQNSTANTHSEIRANITATCAKGSKQITFTLRKVMGGAPGLNPIIYQLAPTQKTLSFSRTSANALTPSSQSSQINVARTEGNTTTILSSAQTGITYSWGFDTSTTAQESGKAVGTSISISNTQANSHYQVWVELSTGDRETLPIVKDGQNGAIGDTPVQAYQWDITAQTELPSGSNLKGWSFVAPARPSTAGDHFLWMTQSVKHTALDGTVTYDTWSAATRVSGDNGTNGENAQYIYLKGTARDVNNTVTTNIPCVVNVNGGTNAATVNRGLNLVTINRQTLAVVESINYDTYGEAAEETGKTGITDLIAKLNVLDSSVFVCLVSYDAIGWNSSLITALQDYGMSDLPYTHTGRYPFLFIGYKGLGYGNGLLRMRDKGAYTDVVELAAYVANGALSAGADGEDAVSIDITPASLIVNQDLQNPDNLSSLTQTFVVKVYRGNVEQTVNSLSFESEVASTTPITTYKAFFLNNSGRNAGSGNINGSTLTLKKIGTYQVTEGTTTRNVYYDSMYADVTATYNTNRTITARVRIYANLLGTWAETVEADVKHEVATGKFYFEDSDGNVVAHETIGDYIKSSTENISTLTKKVNNGKNLLSGVLTGDGWKSCASASLSATMHDITMNGNVITAYSGDSFIVSPNVSVTSGQDYAVSFRFNTGGSFTVHVIGASTQIVVSASAGGSYSFTFNAPVTENVKLFIQINGIFYPQLETGTTATAFDAGTTEVSSRIKQTADEINFNVEDVAGDVANLALEVGGITQQVTKIRQDLPENLVTLNGWYDYNNSDNLADYDEVTKKVEATSQFVDNDFGYNVQLQAGTYCFSFYGPADYQLYINDNQVSLTSVTGDTYNGFTRRYYTFTCGEGTVNIDLYSPNSDDTAFYAPFLEVGSLPSSLNATTGMVKVEGDNIYMGVKNGLNQSGINIDDQTIDLLAQKVTFSYMDGQTKKSDKIRIDPTSGTLYAVDGVFDGSLLFHKVIVDVTNGSDISSLFTMYGVNGNEVPLNQSAPSIAVNKIVLNGDIFILNGPKDNNGHSVFLPPATYFKGAKIKIINGTYADSGGQRVNSPTNLFLNVFYPNYALSTKPAGYDEVWADGDGYMFNYIYAAIPFKYTYTDANYDEHEQTICAEPQSAAINYGWSNSRLIVECKLYKSLELVATKNPLESSPDRYVWMIIDTKE